MQRETQVIACVCWYFMLTFMPAIALCQNRRGQMAALMVGPRRQTISTHVILVLAARYR